MKNTKDLLESLQKRLNQFYIKLTNGDISNARKNFCEINKIFNELVDDMDISVTDLENIYSSEIKIIAPNWNALKKLYIQLVKNIEKDMPRHMTNEEVKSDLEVYLPFFKEIFEKIISDMSICIITIIPPLNKIIEQQKSLPPIDAKYSDSYLKQKKNKTYREYKKMIENQENKVLDYLKKGKINKKTITDIILDPSPWANYYHAWLSNPIGAHRIVYEWNPKKRKVTFVTIDTKKNLKIEA